MFFPYSNYYLNKSLNKPIPITNYCITKAELLTLFPKVN